MDQPAKKKARKPSKLRRSLIISGVALVCCSAFGYANSRLYLFYPNFHTVVDKQVYRSARPNASRLHRWFQQYGIQTVIDLECGDDSDRPEMKALGIVELDIQWPSGRLPPTAKLRGLITAIETCPKPLLIHCRAGAERTGVASIIAAMAIGHQDYDTARQQLSSKYFHVWHDPERAEGVVDVYENYCRAKHLSTGGWEQFRQWAMTVYDEPDVPESHHQAARN
jgi:hypothetical protein